MCDKNVPNDPGFNVLLSLRMNYMQVGTKDSVKFRPDGMTSQQRGKHDAILSSGKS